MPDTLAQKVRAKFPGVYDDLSDQDLEAKVIAKYPGVYDDIPRSSVSFDDSGATPEVSAAYRSFRERYPSLPALQAIRVNPALGQQRIEGQYVGNGVVEIDPSITDQAKFDEILLHEIDHMVRGKASEHDSITVPLDALSASPDFTGENEKDAAGDATVAPGILGTLKDVASGARAGFANTVYGGGDLIRRATGMDRIIDEPDVKAAMTPPESTAGKVGFAGEQLAEFFIPTGVVGKAGKVAEVVKAGALTAAQTGSAPAASTSAALTAALPVVGAVAGKASTALRESALETMANSLRATKEWAKDEATKLAPEMLKRGIGGSIKALRAQSSEMASKVGVNLEQAYKAAAAAGDTVPGQIVRGNIQLASDALHTTAANGTRLVVPGTEEAVGTLQRLDEFVDKLGPDIPVDKAAIIKRQFDDIVSKAGLYGQNAMAPASDKAKAWAFREAANSFRALLNTNPTIEALNKEASFWIGLRDVVNATKLRKVGQTGGLIAAGTGSAGAVMGALSGDSASDRATKALLGGIAGRQLVRVLQSPAYMSRVSAPMKDALASALASGNPGAVASVAGRIASSLPAQLSQRVTP